MLKVKQHSHGGFLVLAALTIVVLIAVAGLALDIGRVLVLRTEMQNAVDAAALAAAAELDNRDDARARAMDAARHTIIHNSHFARITSLLGDDGLPDEAFTFFCAIGSQHDIAPDADGFVDFCSGGQASGEPEKYLATSDFESHYVRITLSEAISNNSNQFTADLLFLPILKLINTNSGPLEPLESISLSASALAGRSFYSCNYPPMALCDPFESLGTHFKDAMPVGGHIELKQQGSNQWASGNFGFLQPLNAGPGASDVALYLSDEGLTGCTPPIVTTKPGGMTQKTKSALNTRLDIYGAPAPYNQPSAPADYPPAPSVSQYPMDQTTLPIDSRFGSGNWNFTAYKQQLIDAGLNTASMPAEWSAITPKRWDVYNWEISTGNILTPPDPSHLYTGSYPPPRSIPERRLLFTAVLSCNALGLTGGKSTAPIFGHDGFAKIFMFKEAEGPPNANIYGEYIGWGDENDAQYHVDIQLYE